MTDQNVIDKSLRSVFVGNIPYDVTEEKLKDIFSEVGPVVSFKIVYDRETGKPKGYGFCEYRDQETAMSAMRNLNNYEISGRTLRVDNACTEKSRLEMQSLMQEKSQENPYGEMIDPTEAPEVISKAVASLPPEQMFELMKQMKLSVQNNPNETRSMLLQNPQLAYALLQGLVVMRVVDPSTAVTMLQKGHGPAPNLHMGGPEGGAGFVMHPPVNAGPPGPPMGFPQVRPGFGPPMQNDTWQQHPGMAAGPPAMGPRGGLLGDRPFAGQDIDLRMGPSRGDHDLRVLAGQPPMGGNIPPAAAAAPVPPVRGPQPMGDVDRRDPRTAAAGAPPPGPRDPRAGVGRPMPGPGPQPVGPAAAPSPAVAAAGRNLTGQLAGSTDQEKAALIMQVLQLSDEQIALLPPDQRQSIMVLKEQIARSSQPR